MRPIRVLVVDDSAVVRGLMSQTLGIDPEIDVVGTAATEHLAISKAAALRPDVVTLDGDLRHGDALHALRTLKAEHPDLVVLMVTTPTPAGAALALAALDAGADDSVTTPESAGGLVAAQRMLLTQVLPRVKALARARRHVPGAPGRDRDRRPPRAPVDAALARLLEASGVRLAQPPPPAPTSTRTRPYTVLTIGASTGGPDALAKVFSAFGTDLRLPVLVCQHMPQHFTALLAARLDDLSDLQVTEATDGDLAVPGRALVAPGDRHLELHRDGPRLVVRLSDGPRENFVRPAADVLFRTAAAACGAGVLAAVLTGMGRDGANGARDIRVAGGTVLAQDRETSVVWGMPGVVAEQGLANEVLPLQQLGPALVRRARLRV